MLRFSQYTQRFSPGIGWGFVYFDVPYYRNVGLHLTIWKWHAHLTWNFEGE
jgi:hypothetical protein